MRFDQLETDWMRADQARNDEDWALCERLVHEIVLRATYVPSLPWASLGVARSGLGKRHGAIAAHRRAVELVPYNETFSMGLFHAFADLGMNREAVKELIRFRQLVGEHEDSVFAEEAERWLSNPDQSSSEVLDDLDFARIAQHSARFPEAAQHYESHLSLGVPSHDVIIELAFVYMHLSESDDSHPRVPQPKRASAKDRLEDLVGVLEDRYAGHPEARFWACFFRSHAFSRGSCESLAKSLVQENPLLVEPRILLDRTSPECRFSLPRFRMLLKGSPTLRDKFVLRRL